MLFTKIIFFIIPLIGYANLKELETKQSVNNIRYISSDGKVTYFQSFSGKLNLNINYKSQVILKEKKSSNFIVHISKEKKKVLVALDTTYHSYLNANKTQEIFVGDYAKNNLEYLGVGLSPKLHLKDQFASYFNPIKSEVYVHNLKTQKIKTFKIINKTNPYFVPQVRMVSATEIIYTDINDKGYHAIVMYSFIDKKITKIFKANTAYKLLSFSLYKDNLYISEVSVNPNLPGTKFFQIPLYNNNKFKKQIPIYLSQFNDIVNFQLLEDKLFFIKTVNYNKELNKAYTDIAYLDLKNNHLKVITKNEQIKQIIKMDKILLGLKAGKIYLIYGNANKLKNDKVK
ncbi:MAG: hypothetical protein N4A33_13355 [Bacteriovoracaceae bacterium]|jgi:hypothetical protein|nr:hypothetical protein [Bacteriovoracaceae bacterium]